MVRAEVAQILLFPLLPFLLSPSPKKAAGGQRQTDDVPSLFLSFAVETTL